MEQAAAARAITLQYIGQDHVYESGYWEVECIVRMMDLLEAEASSRSGDGGSWVWRSY